MLLAMKTRNVIGAFRSDGLLSHRVRQSVVYSTLARRLKAVLRVECFENAS